jgi:hypothetical protein
MIWLSYHFDWTLPAAIFLILVSLDINKHSQKYQMKLPKC